MADHLLELLGESRDRAMAQGDYAGALREHEAVLRQASRMLQLMPQPQPHQRAADPSGERTKIEAIKEQIQAEIVLLDSLARELSALARGDTGSPFGGGGGGRSTQQQHSSRHNDGSDPDVWPPPTADPHKPSYAQGSSRAVAAAAADAVAALPSWARQSSNVGSNREDRRAGGAQAGPSLVANPPRKPAVPSAGVGGRPSLGGAPASRAQAGPAPGDAARRK